MGKPMLLVLLAGGCLWLPNGGTRAAESHDGCAGFIDTVPTTIYSQGVWCLRGDLTHAGVHSAIFLAANNVTLDCNGHGVEGLAGADDALGYGVFASGHENVTVRNCRFTGFRHGIEISGGGGHLVEDNVVAHAYRHGIEIRNSDGAVVRRNRVLHTGGGRNNDARSGISIEGVDGAAFEVRDNVVSGVRGTSQYYNRTTGIRLLAGATATVSGNRIARLEPAGAGMTATGISIGNGPDQTLLLDNEVGLGSPSENSRGFSCNGQGLVRGNVVRGFQTAFTTCTDGGGNSTR